ncbi:MAG: class D beta-lactamase [Rickettsiales bacterium]|nr:class D beta-lactamase [Rickettsiales bacterium]
MKKYLILATLILLNATNSNASETCTIIADRKSDKIILSNGECKTRYTPASTFKFPLAIIGFDSGILKDGDVPKWKYRKNYVVNTENDILDTTPKAWLKNSVVWYSQKLTKKLGLSKFENYIQKFDYGNQDLSGNTGKNDGLTNSWLSSSLKISPQEQLQFINKFLDKKLEVSAESYSKTYSSMPVFETKNGWKIYGKTGSGKENNLPLGWFIGWAEKKNKTLTFVKLIKFDKPITGFAGPFARDETLKDFEKLK